MNKIIKKGIILASVFYFSASSLSLAMQPNDDERGSLFRIAHTRLQGEREEHSKQHNNVSPPCDICEAFNNSITSLHVLLARGYNNRVLGTWRDAPSLSDSRL